MTKMSGCTSFQGSWPKECNGTTDDTQHHGMTTPFQMASWHHDTITWHQHWCQWHHVMPMLMVSHHQDGHVTPHFSYLDIMNAVVAYFMPFLLCLANICVSNIRWWKSYIALHLEYFDLMYEIVPFTLLLALCDTNTGASDMTWPKKVLLHLIWSFWGNKCNHAIENAISVMVPMPAPNASHNQKCHIAPYFDYLD